jgi:hypothetical protein
MPEPTIIYDFDPRNLPQEYLTAIGVAVASSAQTESVIELAIAGCLGVDQEYGAAITTHMAAPLRFSVLRSVAEIKIDDLDALDELDELLVEAETAGVKRNAIAHHSWCWNSKTREVFTVKEVARTSYTMDLIPMPIDAVKSDAEFIYQIGMKLMMFIQKHGIMPDTTPLRNRFHKTKPERKKRREALLRKK